MTSNSFGFQFLFDVFRPASAGAQLGFSLLSISSFFLFGIQTGYSHIIWAWMISVKLPEWWQVQITYCHLYAAHKPESNTCMEQHEGQTDVVSAASTLVSLCLQLLCPLFGLQTSFWSVVNEHRGVFVQPEGRRLSRGQAPPHSWRKTSFRDGRASSLQQHAAEGRNYVSVMLVYSCSPTETRPALFLSAFKTT